MSSNSTFGWPEYVSAASSIATVVMVIYTHFTLRATRKSLLATQRSAEATEKSVERMKDTQRPYFNLGVTNKNGAFYLNIRNIGPGLGKIRLVSIREDLKVSCVLSEPLNYWIGNSSEGDVSKGTERIVGFAIGAADEFTFRLEFSSQFFADPRDWMSSLSVFYEDVYGRLYRSRILYKWEQGDDFLRSIDSEMYPIEKLPVEPASNYDVGILYDLEGNRKPIPYRPEYRMFYHSNFVRNVEGITLSGTSLTHNRNLVLEKIIISWHGYPEFQLKIDDHQSFQIRASYRDGHLLKYDIPTNDQTFAYYGLQATGETI